MLTKELLVESLENELQELFHESVNPFMDLPEDYCIDSFRNLPHSERVKVRTYFLEVYGPVVFPYDKLREILW
jgi:hypothetical protein